MRALAQRRPPAPGLTLVELLVVLAVLGVLVALALPGAAGPEATRLHAAAAEVAQALRYARSEALRSGRLIGVRIDAAGGRVVVSSYQDEATATTLAHPADRRSYDLVLASALNAPGLTVSAAAFHPGPKDLIVFDPGGNAAVFDASGIATVPLTGGSVVLSLRGRQASVGVDANGRVTLQ